MENDKKYLEEKIVELNFTIQTQKAEISKLNKFLEERTNERNLYISQVKK